MENMNTFFSRLNKMFGADFGWGRMMRITPEAEEIIQSMITNYDVMIHDIRGPQDAVGTMTPY
jgi:hypothetical protein